MSLYLFAFLTISVKGTPNILASLFRGAGGYLGLLSWAVLLLLGLSFLAAGSELPLPVVSTAAVGKKTRPRLQSSARDPDGPAELKQTGES